MQKIWKYKIAYSGESKITLKLPPHAKILSIQWQENTGISADLCMWVMFEHNLLLNYGEEVRTFLIIGTGQEFDYDLKTKYLTTIQDGSFVWHIFERTDKRHFKKNKCNG